MKQRQSSCFVLAASLLLACLVSCTRHEVDVRPIEIKPIHITMDVNVKVDRALNDFFKDIDEAAYGDSDGAAPEDKALQPDK